MHRVVILAGAVSDSVPAVQYYRNRINHCARQYYNLQLVLVTGNCIRTFTVRYRRPPLLNRPSGIPVQISHCDYTSEINAMHFCTFDQCVFWKRKVSVRCIGASVPTQKHTEPSVRHDLCEGVCACVPVSSFIVVLRFVRLPDTNKDDDNDDDEIETT